MSDQQQERDEPQNAGGRIVVTGHAVVHKGGRKRKDKDQAEQQPAGDEQEVER